jgi:transposase-like protein
MGILERGGDVRVHVVGNRKKHLLETHVRAHIKAGSAIYSDNFASYDRLNSFGFRHQVVDHAEKYVDGQVHTNGLENFWSLVKRGLKGTYISVEPFHLFRYLDEQVYRYNKRKLAHDGERFELALSQVAGKRLTFKEVTGKVGETSA